MRNLLVGFVAGIAVGWVAFAQRDDPVPRRERDQRARPIETVRARPRVHRPDAPTAPPTPIYDATWIRTAGRSAIARLAHEVQVGESQLDPSALEAALTRLEAAHAARQWPMFSALLKLLAPSNHPAVHKKFVALMGDTSVRFHDWRIAEVFRVALTDSVAPGILDAARQRLEFEFDEYKDEHRYSGWIEIVARYGTADDLDWVVEKTKERDLNALAVALAHAAANPRATEHLAKILAGGTRLFDAGRIAHAFGEANPEAARAVYRAGLENLDPRRDSELSHRGRDYAVAVTNESLDEARAFLVNLTDPYQRIAGAYAVATMKQRGLDVSGLDSVVTAPIEYAEKLARASEAERRREGSRPRYAIEYNRLAWTKRAADALDALADVTKDRGEREALQGVAREIRARLGLDGAEWKTAD